MVIACLHTHRLPTSSHLFHQYSHTHTEDVEAEVSGIVKGVLHGRNVTVMAYGETGSGKTRLVEGDLNDPGLVDRLSLTVFREMSTLKDHTFRVRLSAFEVYDEQLRDLLSLPNLQTSATTSLTGMHIRVWCVCVCVCVCVVLLHQVSDRSRRCT